MNNRAVQLIELEILTNFIKICKKHNLRYYITGGALIGVLRHKGFVPWDDDIDIGMPRPDYERFLEISKDVLPERYAISNHTTDPNWFFALSQLVDKNTIIDIYMNEKPRRCHLWLDIFPLDGLPKGSINRWFHIKRILFFRYLIQMDNITTQVDTHKVGRPLYEKIVLKILKTLPLSKLLDSEKNLQRLDRCLKKHDFYNSEYAGNMLGKYREREAVPQKYFGKPKFLIFEDISVAVPEMSHELQTALYGNYMQLPPEKDRVSHDIKIISM